MGSALSIDRNYIESFSVKQTPVMVLRENVYELNANGRFAKMWAWLYGKMLKHKQLRSFYERTTVTEKVVIDQSDFTTKLYEYYKVASRERKPAQVYVGPAEFQEMARASRAATDNFYSGFISFDVVLDAGIRNASGMKLGGINVTVVPYMKGVLIV
jgi:fatty acid-binding protein DegV